MFRILKLASPSHASIKNLQTLSITTFKTLVRLAGLEPATCGLGNQIPPILTVPPNEQILNPD